MLFIYFGAPTKSSSAEEKDSFNGGMFRCIWKFLLFLFEVFLEWNWSTLFSKLIWTICTIYFRSDRFQKALYPSETSFCLLPKKCFKYLPINWLNKLFYFFFSYLNFVFNIYFHRKGKKVILICYSNSHTMLHWFLSL